MDRSGPTRPRAMAAEIARLMLRKEEKLARVPRRFFGRRGQLDLHNDTAQHRRFAYLYEDMLS
ncbi:hypothetical protein HFP57_00275 [Parasphingopyxis algicola]|uniref:hypothetical protein n=1 Tax=Parasphingopyxis algicola TaxID=2026624 RepID=UPI0015A30480|nr:hypothetical protein [Parasphingopyxis algicola]QLC23617.1 hypothetical protein HFP57_00275 [Parasphingopyxis algicola]